MEKSKPFERMGRKVWSLTSIERIYFIDCPTAPNSDRGFSVFLLYTTRDTE